MEEFLWHSALRLMTLCEIGDNVLGCRSIWGSCEIGIAHLDSLRFFSMKRASIVE